MALGLFPFPWVGDMGELSSRVQPGWEASKAPSPPSMPPQPRALHGAPKADEPSDYFAQLPLWFGVGLHRQE